MKIENRVIYKTTGGEPSFDFLIQNIPFEPDYMIIKSLSVINLVQIDSILLLRSTLTNKSLPMFSFSVNNPVYISSNYPGIFGVPPTQLPEITLEPTSLNIELNLKFPLGKAIDGLYTFDILDIVNDPPTLAGPPPTAIALNIEFVKED